MPRGHNTPAINPSGQGNAVTDGVLFNPWFEQPGGSPVQRVVFQILGPRSATPGDTLDYIIDYYTSYAIDNAMLIFSIPYGSNFVSASNGGQYFGSSGQVYWQLGNLPAMTQSSIRVRVQSLWGLPASFPDASAVMMGGSNLQIAPYAIDTAPYAGHTPVQVTGSTQLSTDQIDAALNASPALKTLYNQFIAQGYKRLGGTEITSSDGHHTTQVLLVHPQSYALVDLRRDQATTEIAAITFAGDVVTVTNANGAMSFDLLQNTASGSGLWAERAIRRGSRRSERGACRGDPPVHLFPQLCTQGDGDVGHQEAEQHGQGGVSHARLPAGDWRRPHGRRHLRKPIHQQGQRDRARLQRGQGLHQVPLRMRQPRHARRSMSAPAL